jgi:hypothetical protein
MIFKTLKWKDVPLGTGRPFACPDAFGFYQSDIPYLISRVVLDETIIKRLGIREFSEPHIEIVEVELKLYNPPKGSYIDSQGQHLISCAGDRFPIENP